MGSCPGPLRHPRQAPEPWRAGAGSRFGVADRMRRDRRERPRRGGRERDTGSAEEDGNVQHRMPCRMACHDQRHDGVRAGACRPGPPRQEAGVRVGPRRAPIGRLSTRMVREWRATLLANGVSVSVAAKAYRLLRAILMTAVEDDKILPRNPCRIRGAGTEDAGERPVLTVAQVFELAER